MKSPRQKLEGRAALPVHPETKAGCSRGSQGAYDGHMGDKCNKVKSLSHARQAGEMCRWHYLGQQSIFELIIMALQHRWLSPGITKLLRIFRCQAIIERVFDFIGFYNHGQ
jgi:hypothetical protein